MHHLMTRAAAGIAALLLIGGITSGAAEAAAPDVTVRGTVVVDGRSLAAVAVGTWSPTRGRLSTTVTDERGAFALRVPAGAAVDAWAGADPASRRAVFAAGARHLVRGVIGAAAPSGAAAALAQQVRPTAPEGLGAGRPLRFRLRTAGKFTAAVPDGGTGGFALDRGGDLAPVAAPRDGRVGSGWLVPGPYTIRWRARAGRLPVETRVQILSGITTVPAPVLPVSTTLRIRITSSGAPVGAGVPVVRRTDDDQEAVGSTDATGTVVVHGLAPGVRTYLVGRSAVGSDDEPPQPPTDDRYLPAAPLRVTVRAGQKSVTTHVTLAPAARVEGRVPARRGHPVLVIAEDRSGAAVRSTTATNGAFSLGGLPSGRYRLIAEDQHDHRYAATEIGLTAGATTVVPGVLVPTTADPVLSARLQGAGLLLLRAPVGPRVLVREVDAGRSSRCRVALPPGRYVPVVSVVGRVQVVGRPIVVRGSMRLQHLTAAQTAAVRGRIEVGGERVPVAPDLLGPRVPSESGDGPLSSDISSTGTDEHGFSTSGLPAGRYRVVRLEGPLPAADGPWSYAVPRRAFVLRAGRTTDLGSVRTGLRG